MKNASQDCRCHQSGRTFIEGAFIYHAVLTGKLFNEVSSGEVCYFARISSHKQVEVTHTILETYNCFAFVCNTCLVSRRFDHEVVALAGHCRFLLSPLRTYVSHLLIVRSIGYSPFLVVKRLTRAVLFFQQPSGFPQEIVFSRAFTWARREVTWRPTPLVYIKG